MAGYAVAHLDEIEEFADAGCRYRPIRHHLGITAFGAAAWTARAARASAAGQVTLHRLISGAVK